MEVGEDGMDVGGTVNIVVVRKLEKHPFDRSIDQKKRDGLNVRVTDPMMVEGIGGEKLFQILFNNWILIVELNTHEKKVIVHRQTIVTVIAAQSCTQRFDTTAPRFVLRQKGTKIVSEKFNTVRIMIDNTISIIKFISMEVFEEIDAGRIRQIGIIVES